MATNISSVEINADPEKVWTALTDPEWVQKWQYGSELTTNWEIGGKIRFENQWEGQVFEQYGTVLAFDPYRSLKYTLFFPRPDLEDCPENYFEMEYRLSPRGSNTLLQIIQEDNRPGAKQEEPQGADNPILKSLKTLIET